MSEYPHKFLSVSSSENRDSTESSEARGSIEEFYEEIEAPKFVDFTVPDNYRPDDRYWFCSRVGCDQKHEEGMDSEEIYKNFVLRVMAARSPNIRLKKALDRNASRTPRKCPLSAPPKPSKMRLSKMVITSSISEKLVNGGKKKVVRTLLKPSSSTPLTKTKPVAAKYLTTPRNKKCADNQSSFRSVGITKTNTVEISKSRTMVAKTLNFNHYPEKVKNTETCNDLRTPITKLCEGMSKLEISKQRKVALANSGKLCKKGLNVNNASKRQIVSSKKSKGKPEDQYKSERTTKCSKVTEKFSNGSNKAKLLGDNCVDASKNAEEELTAKRVEEEFDECQESKPEEAYSSSVVPVLSINSTDLASTRNTSSEGKSSKLENSTNEENNCKNSVDENNICEAETGQHECIESDDKENDAASDQNRILDKNSIQNGTKPFGKREKHSQVKKVAAQAKVKNAKEGLISSSPVIKPNKPKITNPKPFRLRTDERGILKEATLDKRTNHVVLETDGSNLSTPGKKTQGQLEDDIQRGNGILCSKTVPIGQEKLKLGRDEKKPANSPAQSNAMKRLEKFRKTTTSSPLSRKSSTKHQRIEKTTINEDMISFLVPGKRLEVIHEAASPDASELKSTTGNDGQQQQASHSSSRRKKSVTVSNDPNFRSIRVPQSCTKKVK